MRVRMTFSYDGTAFLGYQKQPGERTVQGELELTMSKIFNKPVAVAASGRTDVGVHALAQVAHFDINKTLDLEKLRYSLNCLLPKDIHIMTMDYVLDTFHARIGAQKKTYRYIINMGEANPFYEHYRYELKRQLNIQRMEEGIPLFIGQHNFHNFTTKKEDFQKFIRTIYSIDMDVSGDIVTFTITGSGFMKYMVRMIVGTLVACGLEKIDKSYIEAAFLNKRQPVNHQVPGCGLYLVQVYYEGGYEHDTL